MASKPKPHVKKVVLAYSGGLDTSVIVPWLKENYDCEVICFCADVGQGDEDLTAWRQKRSTAAPASSSCGLEGGVRRGLSLPPARAGAIYERKYLLGTSIARPLIAKHQVEVAHQEGADAVAHGCTGKGNDQVRFELTFMALDPRLKVIAPWREWDIRSREDALAYAEAHNVPVTGDAQIHLQPRPQPVAHLPRGRPARRSLERAGRGHVPASASRPKRPRTSPNTSRSTSKAASRSR